MKIQTTIQGKIKHFLPEGTVGTVLTIIASDQKMEFSKIEFSIVGLVGSYQYKSVSVSILH